MTSVGFAAGDAYYTVTLRSYSAPTRATRHDPGDGGSADLEPSATVEFDVGATATVDTAAAIRHYAAERGISLDRAESEIDGMALDAAREDALAVYEDHCDRLGDEQREMLW